MAGTGGMGRRGAVHMEALSLGGGWPGMLLAAVEETDVGSRGDGGRSRALKGEGVEARNW